MRGGKAPQACGVTGSGRQGARALVGSGARSLGVRRQVRRPRQRPRRVDPPSSVTITAWRGISETPAKRLRSRADLCRGLRCPQRVGAIGNLRRQAMIKRGQGGGRSGTRSLIRMRGQTGRSGPRARPRARAKPAASKAAARDGLVGATAELPRVLREATKAGAGHQEAAVKAMRGLRAVDSWV